MRTAELGQTKRHAQATKRMTSAPQNTRQARIYEGVRFNFLPHFRYSH